MSIVTNLILAVGTNDVDIDEINKYFSAGRLTEAVGGGSMYFENRTFYAAMNHMGPIDRFCDFLRSFNFDWPEEVQVIVAEQDDYKYRVIDVFAEKSEIPHRSQLRVVDADRYDTAQLKAWRSHVATTITKAAKEGRTGVHLRMIWTPRLRDILVNELMDKGYRLLEDGYVDWS